MQVNIVTNLTNQAGLQRDYEILRGLLEGWGIAVHGVQFNDYTTPVPEADIAIFLEVVTDPAIRSAKEVWFVPNDEWYYSSWDGAVTKRFSKVLCKTRHSEMIWENKLTVRARPTVQYIGWESKDLYDPQIVRTPTVLHVAGKSMTKNTGAVLEAWERYGHDLPHLEILTQFPIFQDRANILPNVTCWNCRVPEFAYMQMLNKNRFLLMPSAFEGYGHIIHEGLGCGSVVITTLLPPMDEFSGVAYSIPPCRKYVQNNATMGAVSPDDIANIVRLATGNSCLEAIGDIARTAFLNERVMFRERLKELFDAL